ncbi:uncharacterized protein LOC107359380 [Tetranychus urticae]|nr:uncharacterized protein LOC107359380 [Tetranychus urticae]
MDSHKLVHFSETTDKLINHNEQLIKFQDKCKNDFSIDWFNLTYRLYPSPLNNLIHRFKRKKRLTGNKTILRDLNGTFKSGKLSAIMGPSGSGKTTLIECLAGIRVKGVEGDLRLTGRSRVTKAFIPQEDILCSQLTVREALMYSYGLKVGSKLIGKRPYSTLPDYVKEASITIGHLAHQLNLTDCFDVRISSISGGQKKRTSIAQELVSKPDVLLMDEPTSGLDSSSCYQLIKLLQRIASESSMAVIITIHQPSSRTFNLLQDVYMLSFNGKILFHGLPNQVVPTLTAVGVKCDVFNNPADLLNEVAYGEHGYDVLDKMVNKMDANFNPYKYSDNYTNHLNNVKPNGSVHLFSRPLLQSYFQSEASFLSQFKILMSRQLKLCFRNQMSSTVRIVIAIQAVFVIGLMYPNKGLADGCVPDLSHIPISDIKQIRGSIEKQIVDSKDNVGSLFWLLFLICLANMMPMSAIIPIDTKLFCKEFANGWYRIESYFIARNLADLPFILLCDFISVTGIFILTAQPMDRYNSALFIYILVSFNAATHGTILGTVFMHDIMSAVFATPNTLLPFILFSGYYTRISGMPILFRFISIISYPRYGFEAFMVAIFGYNRCKPEGAQSLVHARDEMNNFLDTMFQIAQTSLKDWHNTEDFSSLKNQTINFTNEIAESVTGPWFNENNRSGLFNYFDIQDSDYNSSVLSLIISLIVGQLIAFFITRLKSKSTRFPVTVVDVLNSTSTNETIPDPVNINGSVAVLDTTLPPVELTTTADMINLRNARSEEEPVKLSSESPNSPDQVKNKSSAIQFPKDDVIEISSDVTNTSASSSTPVEPVIKLAITDSIRMSVEEVESAGATTPGVVGMSSTSSSTKTDVLTTQKPLTTTANATGIISSSNSSVVDSEIRVGRSQSEAVEDATNAQTLSALTTLSSIINQTSCARFLVFILILYFDDLLIFKQMFPLKLISSSIFRSLVHNKVNVCKYANASSTFNERYRKELLDHFEQTNSQVFNMLKEMSSKSPKIDWAALRQNLINEYPRVYNKFNFEVQFMQHLLKIDRNEDEIILSFINHVKQLLADQSNKVIQCHLIRFLLKVEKKPDINYIRNALETISKDEMFIKYPVVGKAWADFSTISAESCKQSIDFASKHHVLKNDALLTLCISCLKFGFFEDIERLLVLYSEKKLENELVDQWLNTLSKVERSKRIIEIDRFFKILEEKRYLFQKSMLNKLEKFLNASGLYFKPGIVDIEKCSCKVCGSPLQTINETEVSQIRKAVEDYILRKDGVAFLISTPTEVKDFNRFMDSHSSKPFDLVIDGLNVSYYNTTRTVAEDKKTHSLSIKNLGLSESLYETMEINDILVKYKKILVIGRKHMGGWPSIKQLKENHSGQVWIYLLDNKSEDDIFTIDAALHSAKTYIWTADFLRQYRDLLGNDCGDLFEKWKYCRQIRFAPGSKRKLEFPNNIDYVCQSTSSGFYHIPVNMNVRVDSQERINAHWLCVGTSLR